MAASQRASQDSERGTFVVCLRLESTRCAKNKPWTEGSALGNQRKQSPNLPSNSQSGAPLESVLRESSPVVSQNPSTLLTHPRDGYASQSHKHRLCVTEDRAIKRLTLAHKHGTYRCLIAAKRRTRLGTSRWIVYQGGAIRNKPLTRSNFRRKPTAAVSDVKGDRSFEQHFYLDRWKRASNGLRELPSASRLGTSPSHAPLAVS